MVHAACGALCSHNDQTRSRWTRRMAHGDKGGFRKASFHMMIQLVSNALGWAGRGSVRRKSGRVCLGLIAFPLFHDKVQDLAVGIGDHAAVVPVRSEQGSSSHYPATASTSGMSPCGSLKSHHRTKQEAGIRICKNCAFATPKLSPGPCHL